MGYRPLRYCRITNPFGAPGGYASDADRHGPAGHHTGIDFGRSLVPPLVTLEGRPIRSSTPGVVVISNYNDTMGNWVGVYYARDNVTITYWHMQRRNVHVGDTIARGKVIGWVGSTGNSTAPHLHVQANHGRGFDYDGHIAPGRWVRGRLWARLGVDEAKRGSRRRKPVEAAKVLRRR